MESIAQPSPRAAGSSGSGQAGRASLARAGAYAGLWDAFIVSLLLIVGIQVAATVWDAMRSGWWPAYDTNAYWLAADHVLHGQVLYEQSTIYGAGIFKYPPIFAQLFLPMALVPEIYVDWIWRISGLLCLRYLCGSWAFSLIAGLQWPAMWELSFGNVTLQLGAVCLFALRDRRGAYLLPWFAGMKFGPALLILYLWFARPDYRRPLLTGCLVFAAACLVSLAVAPGLWVDYLGTFGWEAASEMKAYWVWAIVPGHGGLDLAIRVAIGLAVVLVAIRRRTDWLAFVAATMTMPIFAVSRLSVLTGLWPLRLRDRVDAWRRSGGYWQDAASEGLERLGMLPKLVTAKAERRT
jgi:hypothetical protein